MGSTAEEQSTIASSISDDDQQHQHFAYAMQLVTSSVLPMTLQAAFELGLFEILAKAGNGAELSPTEITAKITTSNPDAASMIDRILRLLATHSVVGCSVIIDENGNQQRLYSLTPVAKYFVLDEDGVSLGALLSMIQDKVFLESWSELKNAVIEGGIPFNRTHGGVHAFEYPRLDQRFNQVFNNGMINHTTMVIKVVVESYNGFANLKQLVDVGGGLGVTLKIITSAYPSIKGINFDLPHVIEDAPFYPGVEHVGGDMFEKVPKGDAIFMKWILHDWSDEHCVKLLKNCYLSIPDDGKVIVMEGVVPTVPETTAAEKAISQGDLLMMTQNPGGKERSRDEFKALATKAGFKHIKFIYFLCNFWIIEFLK
ncbi:caffeic acid 3-O-methyltransferase-like isoform X3 [Cucurbita moschata]|uniref:caffeate O-methyltransferase n=1 Tax=Cucurbita moschata TaxID=3662 RepID=A0A6J1FB75_CUCMO|nr:caffeic acid 3-O-methyltransferase-like isoform X2 [Cucurbita moschata]XP_022937449.1 caffeic acid 3-O-methyltransferase-like isoform X3 [Cucurbita moschata]